MRRGPAVSLAAVAGLVACDQATKWWAERALRLGEPIEVLGPVLQLRLLYNPGAAFSFATNATWIFTIISTVAVVVLAWMLSKQRPAWMRAGLTLMCAGALGNLIDRLFRAPGFAVGHVVDFLELPNWPVFNVADMCITTAGVLLVAMAFFPQRFGIDTPDDTKEPTS